jgi:hypothetical protein
MKKKKLGHVTFRLDPAEHQELLEIAAVLNTDLSGLLKLLIAAAKPEFKLRAALLKEANEGIDRLIQSGGMKSYAQWLKENEEALKSQEDGPKPKSRGIPPKHRSIDDE